MVNIAARWWAIGPLIGLFMLMLTSDVRLYLFCVGLLHPMWSYSFTLRPRLLSISNVPNILVILVSAASNYPTSISTDVGQLSPVSEVIVAEFPKWNSRRYLL